MKSHIFVSLVVVTSLALGCSKPDDTLGGEELTDGSPDGTGGPADDPQGGDDSEGGSPGPFSTSAASTSGASTSDGSLTDGSTSTTTGAIDDGVATGGSCAPEDAALGTYADCKNDGVVDNSVCNNGDSVCLVSALENSRWSVCMFKGCESDCECPAAVGGTADPMCTDITGDGETECLLDCSAGKQCPAGMSCSGGGTPVCVWDDESKLYGDCMNGPDCGEGLQCVFNAATKEQATLGVCVRTNPGCDDDSDCPGWSDSTVVDIDRDCDNVQELGPNVCFAGCDGGTPCPEGMVCYEGVQDICMWPKQ